MGRDIANFAALALAGNQPQLSIIAVSAVLGVLTHLLPARQPWITQLRLE